jgi:hypothetical protein
MPEQLRRLAARLRAVWCRLMHDAAMWPIHGIYRCRTCGQSYPIPWAGEYLLQSARLVIPQAERALETAPEQTKDRGEYSTPVRKFPAAVFLIRPERPGARGSL